jgi:sterol desaturase/sphingolipid hydroxylase (fatty acid hydroxylase superfamily)
MPLWIPDHIRLLALLIVGGGVWALESVIPLYRSDAHRLHHAGPNVVLTLLLILTNMLFAGSTAAMSGYAQHNHMGLLAWGNVGTAISMMVGIAGLDVFTYWAHVLMHKSAMGWRFHCVHHSDPAVDVTTALRQHPGETVWRILWYWAAIVIFAIPLWVVILYLTLSTLNAQLEHANLHLPTTLDTWLRWTVVTPNMHKAHHSRRQVETDSNYSNIFSIWDRLFGTYMAQVDFQTLRYGLDGYDSPDWQTVHGLLTQPFVTGGQIEPVTRRP